MMQDRMDEYPDFANIKVEAAPEAPKKMIEAPDKLQKGDKPNQGIPSLDEWQDFIGRIVLRTLTDAFLSLALRDFEDDLTDREREMIRLTKQDLKEMSAPLASLAHKSKFGRKRGRAIIAAADSSEAVIALVIWMRRVNKIAGKYRRQQRVNNPTVIPGVAEESFNGYSRQDDGPGQGFRTPGFGGIYNPGTG